MTLAQASRCSVRCLAAVLVLTVVVYWPSMHGGFVFDDFNNIVYNSELHLQSLNWEALREAASASPSTVLVRPLAMLSFGLNWYFTGADPLPMRNVNLIIHLLNGLLLFGLLRTLCRSLPPRADNAHLREGWLPLVVTAAWLLAPINFTGVAYIVQRMESLCQVFVLAGLWGYLCARRRMLAGRGGFFAAIASIVLGTVMGVLSKESAVLLPLYALLVEWLVFGFARADGKIDRRLAAMYLAVLVLPACVALYWVTGHALPATAWANRSFTLGERLLTEPRVLWDYIHWSLLPMANELALYHDSLRVSRGLLDPPTTLLAIAGLCALAAAAFAARRRHPLAALGIAWFFAAHLLTATVIPLELVFEHRNYFASIGLYMAVFSFVLPPASARLLLVRVAFCSVLPLFFASITCARALDWGNPLTFALSEAQKNPASPRAAYELARTYMNLSQFHADSPLVPDTLVWLDRAATMRGADALPDYATLEFYARLHREPPQGTWERLRTKLAKQALSTQNVAALYGLTACALNGGCKFPPQQMVDCFLAALTRAPTDTRVLTIYSNYALVAMHDIALATTLSRDAVKARPRSMKMRFNLLAVLAATGQRDAAQAFYDQTLRDLPEARQDARLRAVLDTPTSPSMGPKPVTE